MCHITVVKLCHSQDDFLMRKKSCVVNTKEQGNLVIMFFILWPFLSYSEAPGHTLSDSPAVDKLTLTCLGLLSYSENIREMNV